MNFVVFGAGAWGTAVAIHLQRAGHSVSLVPRRMDHAMAIASSRENVDYLPGVFLDDSIQIGMEPKPVLMEADYVFLGCPSQHLRALCKSLQGELNEARELKGFVTLCKGLEEGTNLTPIDIVAEHFPEYITACFSGPSWAKDVAFGKPTAMTLASEGNEAMITELQRAISNTHIRVYRSADVKGVEWASCLKNVYAIACGISDGLRLGDNAKAALITRILSELVRLGTCLGGQTETFYGLSGVGDLVATCNGEWSRNRTFGQRIAEGDSPDFLLHQKKMTVEGYRTTACFYEMFAKMGVEAPILMEIYRVLYNGKSPEAALKSLMERDLKGE